MRFGTEVTERGRDAIAASNGVRRRGRLRGESRLEKLELQPGLDPATAAEELRGKSGIELVEPNFLVTHAQAGPSDTRFGEQWALQNTGQAGGAPRSDIGVERAWVATTGSKSTVVAVIDSGIDFTHPDLAGNRWSNVKERENGEDDDRDGFADDLHGWDWVADSGVIRDEQGHGTSVAGLIAAEGDNDVGISGVMWHASIMSLRVLDSTGTGDVAAAVEAIDYAVAHGAQVINCSWGTDGDSQLLADAIERAGRKGVVVVASAGNSGRDLDAQPYYPASYDLPNLISVASSDGFDNLAAFSNLGASRVAVAAPGTDILTTQMGSDYRYVSGTSVSAPLVAGIAGLIKTLRPGISAEAVRAAIVGGARPVGVLAGKVAAGGVVDAGGALAALQGNPYARGANNGNGQRNGRGYVPPALRHDNDNSRGKDQSGRVLNLPPAIEGAPDAGLPNLDEIRRESNASVVSRLPDKIHADMVCADCDPGAGGGGSDPYFGTERRRRRNEAGAPGVTLGSRNFHWSLPLVALPGRSGLNLSVSLEYNSLVWTKQGGAIQFNADRGNPAPGFRLGLPQLQMLFVDADTGSNAYMMLTPTGGRVEMLATGSPSVYESTDSTYTQLTFSGSTPVVRTTDGTQYVFGAAVTGGGWRCTQVKDRNGNYISATYDTATGHVLTMTDPLGRVVNFNYYADGNLDTITQTWNGSTHYYAMFYYGSVTMSLNFPGLSVVGTHNGAQQTVLSYVAFPDNESYFFDYNSYGQVYQIRHKAPDEHELAHVRYNISNANIAGAAQTDCPRFTTRYAYAEDWNNNQEVQTTYAAAADNSWVQVTGPDGTTSKELYYMTGWAAGLAYQTETWTGGVRRTWSTFSWTQDNTSLGYTQNPRVYETNEYDEAGRRSRVTVDYNIGYNLPTNIREWGGLNYNQLQRWTAIAYKNDSAYINNRVIGLPYERVVFDGSSAVKSRVVYQYDWGGNDPWGDPYISTQAPSTNYTDPGYVTGRGNLIGIVRYNCTNNTTAYDDSLAIWVQLTGYNKAGSPVWTKDTLGHKTSASYADNFSDGGNSRNTLAYVTSVTNPDGYSATDQYNFDFGGETLTHSPVSGGGGSTVNYIDILTQYDSLGRVERETNQNNGAYRRWVYSSTYKYVQTFQTLVGTTAADEFYSVKIFDGDGRMRASATEHPGSSGGLAGQYLVYDNTGQVTQYAKPTEINSAWVPTGDDASWAVTTQSYDYESRPLQALNPDGTTVVYNYTGCGCAGGGVKTVQDEHGRQRRYTDDVLGRPVTVEELNWNGSVYSTTTYTYNVRDQLTQIVQQGQTRTIGYDGHGRVSSQTTPEQGTTNYTYNTDDTLSTVTDARGAKSVYAYNNRHQVTSLNYDLSGVIAGQNVATTPNVSFAYDAAGNRTLMNDGQGSVTYHYNGLSQMDWEERNFTGLGSYRINYAYNPSGELTSVTNPWSAQVTYSYDRAGRLSAVNGANYAGVSSYAGAFSYRAFNSVKSMNFSNGRSLSASYDNRMRPTSINVAGVLGYNYSYNNFNEKTGRVTYAQSLNDSSLDRSYEYDHLGRLVISHSGAEARAHANGAPWGTTDGPYSQGYDYDTWGNMTHRYGWGGEVQGGSPSGSTDINYAYTNNRRNGFSYDNAGNLTFDLGQHFTYDAAGHQTYVDWTDLHQYYDGDGLRVKKTENGGSLVQYYLRSTALGGQVLAEINSLGGWQRGYVYAGSDLLAVQQGGVFFVHEDPATKSKRVTDMAGSIQSVIELDPYGANTSRSSNAAFQPRKFISYERDTNGTDEAMFRRYNRWHSRFDQPDPYGGSHRTGDPQSFNRYAYGQGDPVNFADPTGLEPPICDASFSFDACYGSGGVGGGGLIGNDFWGAPGISPGPPPSAGLSEIIGDELRLWPLELVRDKEVVVNEFYGFHSFIEGWTPFAAFFGGGGGKSGKPIMSPECRKKLNDIFNKANLLWTELRKYNPISDARGGPTWKPWGHYTEMMGYKNGLINDLKWYWNKCRKNRGGGPPLGPPVPRWIEEMTHRPIRKPYIPRMYVPPAEVPEGPSLWEQFQRWVVDTVPAPPKNPWGMPGAPPIPLPVFAFP